MSKRARKAKDGRSTDVATSFDTADLFQSLQEDQGLEPFPEIAWDTDEESATSEEELAPAREHSSDSSLLHRAADDLGASPILRSKSLLSSLDELGMRSVKLSKPKAKKRARNHLFTLTSSPALLDDASPSSRPNDDTSCTLTEMAKELQSEQSLGLVALYA